MAHGQNANKNLGREYWSRREHGQLSWGKYGKEITHAKERALNKKIINKELKDNS